LIKDVLANMAAGQGVTVVPAHAELTTQQAAELLNVSRPHVIKLLGHGLIRHRRGLASPDPGRRFSSTGAPNSVMRVGLRTSWPRCPRTSDSTDVTFTVLYDANVL